MLKVSLADLDQFESQYPGIKEAVLRFDAASLPVCSACHSLRTAEVHVGINGRTMTIAAATTKFQLVPEDPPGRFFCVDCRRYFDGE